MQCLKEMGALFFYKEMAPVPQMYKLHTALLG